MSKKKVKIRMQAKELESADVSFISLVNRPANRIPFRVTKSEDVDDNTTESNLMFNLQKMFKRDGEEATSVPAIAAICIRKSGSDAILPQLEAQGFDISQTEELDDVLVVKQAEYEAESVTAFKMSEDAAVFVTGVQKSFQPYGDSESFTANLASSGFMPGVMVASEALGDTFRNILRSGESPVDVKANMKVALAEYSSYVMSLASELPVVAFKLEDLEAMQTENAVEDETVTKGDTEGGDKTSQSETTAEEEVSKQDGESGDDNSQGEEDAAGDGGTEGVAKTDEITEAVKGDIGDDILNPEQSTAKKEEGADESTDAEADGAADTESTEVVKDDESKEEVEKAEVPAWVEALKTDLMGGIKGVQDELADVKKSNEDLKDRLDSVEKVAKSADEAARGTVNAGSDVPSESLGNNSRTMRKSEQSDDEWEGVLDNIIPSGSQ